MRKWPTRATERANRVMHFRGKTKAVFCIIVSMAILSFAFNTYSEKELKYWFSSYIKWEMGERIDFEEIKKPIHIMFLLVDHFEPTTLSNMEDWYKKYLSLSKTRRDADGMPFKYTWFYFGDGYRKEILKKLAELCRTGLGEIELHLHHRSDSADSFRGKIRRAKRLFQEVGALKTADGRDAFAYVAGNWALDNSVIIKGKRISGVDNELQILKEEGCYADFTFPSKNMAQPKMINKIYYAFDDPKKPKSYDDGIEMEKGRTRKYETDGFTMFQGPLLVNWRDWKHVFYPSIEDGQIQYSNPPSETRVKAWIRAGVHVKGSPNWIFIKAFTHGASPKNKDVLFGKDMEKMLDLLETVYNDGKNYCLHYVTAREAFNIAKAAEYGLEGDPGQYRDFIIKPYKISIM